MPWATLVRFLARDSALWSCRTWLRQQLRAWDSWNSPGQVFGSKPEWRWLDALARTHSRKLSTSFADLHRDPPGGMALWEPTAEEALADINASPEELIELAKERQRERRRERVPQLAIDETFSRPRKGSRSRSCLRTSSRPAIDQARRGLT